MTIRREQDAVLLEGACGVDDAEVLMQELQAGAARVDWSGCVELHTACLQVLLAARAPPFRYAGECADRPMARPDLIAA